MTLACLLLLPAAAPLPEPPPMPRRAIAEPGEPTPGERIELGEMPGQWVLFVPSAYQPAGARAIGLTIHFHTAAWFGIAEHLRRGLAEPLVVVNLGQGSAVYRAPFVAPARFPALLEQVLGELRRRGAADDAAIARVSISSFSAGYGAVRELVAQPEGMRLIDRVVLCDSLYAGFEPNAGRRPASENMAPWVPFCRAAARGEKTFCFTFSEVPTETYANTAECAAWLAEAVGTALAPVPRGALPATLDPEFALLRRADVGRFHLWGYAGDDAPAHLTHVRHLGDLWRALDAAR